MLKSYFKIGWRNVRRNAGYSIINIGGLAVGLCCFIMMMLYVQHEFSYDNFYPNAGRIFHIYQRQVGNVFLGSDYFASTPMQAAEVLETEYAEVSYAVAVSSTRALLTTNKDSFLERGLNASNHFFNVFQFEFIHGNPAAALAKPTSIVLTKSLARKMFGDANVLGQTITHDDAGSLVVTGIINDPLSNSSLQFSYIVAYEAFEGFRKEAKRPTWHNNNVNTFVLLADHAEANALQAKFPAMIAKYHDAADYANYPFKDEFLLRPMTSMHMMSHVNFDIGQKGNRQYVYLFPVVALMVLLLACVNYMNLAIARSVRRAREVGIRKTAGARRYQIVSQFLGESVLIACFSLVLSLVLTVLILPVFGKIVDRPIELNFISNVWLIPGLLTLVILAGLFSGSYPSLVISALEPIQVLKGKMMGKMSSLRLQRWLIVVQYGVSIALIAGSIVIYQQLRYLDHKELGYVKDNVISVRVLDRKLIAQYEALSNEWIHQTGIVAVTSAHSLPVNIESSTIIRDEDGSGPEDDLPIYNWNVNYDFEQVFGIKLVAGRSFSRAAALDASHSLLLNETGAKALGWTPEEAVGKQFLHDGMKTVIGIVRDFHMHSMHMPIQPLLIELDNSWAGYLSVKIQPGSEAKTIALLRNSLKKYTPYPFEYQFLQDEFSRLYSSETKLAEIFGFFTVVSILLAAVGLFGLAAFAVARRTKEIGIRKVMGATSRNVVALLARDFLSLVVIAFLLAVPLAWYAAHEWLSQFAYRVDLAWWMFAAAGALALALSNLAIGFQSIKAAMANPTDSLKTE